MIFISWWFKFVSYVSIEFTFAEMYLQSPRTTLLNLHLFISPRQDERGQWFCATKTKVWAQLLRLVDKMTGMEIIPSLVEFLDQLHSSFQLQWALCCESSDRVIHALAVAMTRARYRYLTDNSRLGLGYVVYEETLNAYRNTATKPYYRMPTDVNLPTLRAVTQYFTFIEIKLKILGSDKTLLYAHSVEYYLLKCTW